MVKNMKCPCCGEEFSPDKVPSGHLKIVENTKVGYPWYPNLTPKCVFIGAEPLSDKWRLCTVWLFEWHNEDGDDVAAIGTLRIIGTEWNWEFSRMDGTDGEKLIVEVFGIRYENFFVSALAGYRSIGGKLP